jgi:hypothetical protein
LFLDSSIAVPLPSNFVQIAMNSETNASSPTSKTPSTFVFEALLRVTCGSRGPVVVTVPTARLDVDGRDIVGEEEAGIGAGVGLRVDCRTADETGGMTGRICVDVEVVVVATVRVDTAPGIKTVRVETIVDMPTERKVKTPPSPLQRDSGTPFGQQPYSWFGRRLQKVLEGQPPPPGQHISVKPMHAEPQSFRPC